MTDTGSSPFIEHPRDVLHDDSEYNLKQIIGNLQFQLSSQKSESTLLKQSKESLVSRYEGIITEKNEQMANLEENVQFLYKEREQLRDKLENQRQISQQRNGEVMDEIDALKQQNSQLSDKNSRLEFRLKNITGKYEHIKSDLNYELQNTDQLNEQLKSIQGENQRLSSINDELSQNLTLAANQLANDKSQELQNINENLLRTNSQLQLKLDKLLQDKTSNELLKQKNISLMNKVSRLEDFEQTALRLSLENNDLRTKFDDYFKIINDCIAHDINETNESVVLKFVNKFKELKNNKLVLLEKYSQAQARVVELESQFQALQVKVENELSPSLDSLQKTLNSQKAHIQKLEDHKSLNEKEIQFLRTSLKNFDRLVNKQKETTPNNVPSEATNQYLSNLEKLVDQYKSELDSLQKQLATNAQPSIGEKRPRIIDDALNFKKNDINSSLDRENLHLRTQIKNLEDEIHKLNGKLLSSQNTESQKDSFHVLQLKSNPFAKDQLVKQQTLDALRQENTDLIKKIAQDATDDTLELIPKSVFARQEQDKAILQTKVDQLAKKINRLKTTYADKSKEILSIISKYFGYTIEFVPSPVNPDDFSSRIKLMSRYLSNKDGGVGSNAYLLLDLNSKSMKANGNAEFKLLCEELVNNWVNERGQIPCFLSALNLKIYETYVLSS